MASIPLAVSPTNKNPGLYMSVDLLAGVTSPGSSPIRGLILAPVASTGDLEADTELRQIYSETDAAAAFGLGTPGHLAAKALYANHPQANLWVLGVDEPDGTAASVTLTFAVDSEETTAAYEIEVEICGRLIRSVWLAGETVSAVATKLAAAINAKTHDLPVTASANAGVVTLTAKIKGKWGNDIIVSAAITGGAGGTLTLSKTKPTNGAGEPDWTAALATASIMEFDFIVPCLSTADVDASGSTGAKAIQDHINSLNTGLMPKLQQAITASNAASASAPKTGTAARNEATMEHVLCFNGRSLPCEWAGAEAGSRMARREIEPNPNRMGTVLKGVYGAKDLVADTPTETEIRDCLDNGVSIVSYNFQGEPIIVRPITTHSRDSLGNPDVRVLDCNEVDALYEYAKDMRAALPQEFHQVKVTRDLGPTDDPPPDGVVEERDIKEFIRARTMEFWVPRGVVQRQKFVEAVENGTLIVRVNDTDETQVDIVIPAAPFKALSKLGVVIQKVG